MPVSFATELVVIKEYNLEQSERKMKKNALKLVKQNKTTNAYAIRNILYRAIPTEKKYIESRNKGSMGGGIGFIDGYMGTSTTDIKRLYRDGKYKIDYNIHINLYGKMTIKIKLSGFGGRNHYINFYDSGILIEDIFKAEYKAKMFLLKTVTKLFNENNIM